MHELIERLTKNGVVVTDGAWGTQLQQRGLKPGQSPESMNITEPHVVEEVPSLYVRAGSRIVLTNTFGGNRYVQDKMGMAKMVPEMNKAGVEISKRAAGDKACVFASMGPSGKLLLMKQVTESDLAEAFEEQAMAIVEAGADAIVVETMMDIKEALIAIAAAKQTGLPVVGCMVFDAGKNKDRTMMGDTPEQVVELFEKADVDVIGANCGQGIEGFIPICRRMRTETDLPLWMKPNAGLPKLVGGQMVYTTTPEEFTSYVPALIEAGASFIGGCCGSNPDFIRAIRDKVDSLG